MANASLFHFPSRWVSGNCCCVLWVGVSGAMGSADFPVYSSFDRGDFLADSDGLDDFRMHQWIRQRFAASFVSGRNVLAAH